MKFVYDHTLSPKQNLLVHRGEAFDPLGPLPLCSPVDAQELSRLTGWSMQKVMELDVQTLAQDMTDRPTLYGLNPNDMKVDPKEAAARNRRKS